MKTTITIDQGLAKTLNLLKYRYGFSSIEEVIAYYLNKKEEKNGKDIQLVGLEIEKSNPRLNQKIQNNLKPKKELKGSGLPEPTALNSND